MAALVASLVFAFVVAFAPAALSYLLGFGEPDEPDEPAELPEDAVDFSGRCRVCGFSFEARRAIWAPGFLVECPRCREIDVEVSDR